MREVGMLEPLSYDVETLAGGMSFGSLSAFARADALSNLLGFYTPSDNRWAVRRVAYGFSSLGPGIERLEPLVTQFYPSHQETIWGTEGLILTQRVFLPYEAGYERGVCWLIEVQAEGPRLVQVEIHLEFDADDTTLRMQDGLLVATRTSDPNHVRVFGSSGPPSYTDLNTPGRALLMYHVLIEGEIEQPFVLSASDAGEQLAWNGFLVLSDTERVFRETVRALDGRLAQAHLLTPDARVNQTLQWAKIALLRGQQRWRWGLGVPTTLGTDRVDVAQAAWYALGANWLTPDFVGRQLQFLATHAQAEDGRLAATLAAHDLRREPSPSSLPTALFLLAWQRYLNTSLEAADPAPAMSSLPTLYPHLRAAAESLTAVRETVLADTLAHSALHAAADIAHIAGHDDDRRHFAQAAQALAARLARENPGWSVLWQGRSLTPLGHLLGDSRLALLASLVDDLAQVESLLRADPIEDPTPSPSPTGRGEPDGGPTPPPFVGEGAGGRGPTPDPTPSPSPTGRGEPDGGRGLRLAYALAAGRPEWLWETLRGAYPVVERVDHPTEVGATQAVTPATGLDALGGATLLALAVEGLLGCQPQYGGLVLTPRLPSDWPWLAVANLPFQGRPLTLAYLDGVVHTTHKIATPGGVEVYDRADVIPGSLFAVVFRRQGERRLFTATTEAAATFIRVDGRSVPVQLDAGEAALITLD